MPQCIQPDTNDLCLPFLKLQKLLQLQSQIRFAETSLRAARHGGESEIEPLLDFQYPQQRQLKRD